MKCSECGSLNKEGASFCGYCGALLKSGTVDILQKDKIIAGGKYKIKLSSYQGLKQFYQAEDTTTGKEVLITKANIFKPEVKQILQIIIKEKKNKLIELLEDGNSTYLVWDKFSAHSLKAYLSEFIHNNQSFYQLVDKIIKLIAFFHSQGLLCIGISPASIFVDEGGEVFFTDIVSFSPAGSLVHQQFAEVDFSAPEMSSLVPEKVDERTDIYTLGKIIEFLLKSSPSLDKKNPVNAIIKKATQKDKEERFQTLSDLSISLGEALTWNEDEELEYYFYGTTDVGSVRKNNEDAYVCINYTGENCWGKQNFGLFIVSDGMGGVEEGEVASAKAISIVTEYIISKINTQLIPGFISILLKEALTKANEEIYNYSTQVLSRKGMGATITVALIIQNKLFIAHLGDSRAYIIREDKIEQITEDHSLLGKLLQLGYIKQEEAKNFPQKNIIYRALGVSPKIDVDVSTHILKPSDYLLLCTDGLWDYFTPQKLKDAIRADTAIGKTVKFLVTEANKSGGKDNITLILIKFLEKL